MLRTSSWFWLVLLVALALPNCAWSAEADDRVALRIRFGMKDKQGTDWSGRIVPSAGKVESIHGWRWMAGDTAEGDTFTVSTRRAQPQSATERRRVKEGQQMPMSDNGIIVTMSGAGSGASVTFESKPGN